MEKSGYSSIFSKYQRLKQFIKDLTKLLEPYVKSKSDIIVMGDFNETIGITTDGMAQVIQECHLTDVQAFRHGLESEQ